MLAIALGLALGVGEAPPKFAPPHAALPLVVDSRENQGEPPPPPPPPPDVIELRNGDRVTGTIDKMTDGKLVVKTSYAGEVTIAWKEVKSVQMGRPLPIKLKSGAVIEGTLASAGDGVFRVETPDVVGREPIPSDAIVAIAEPPPPGPKWSGFIKLDVAVTRGNQETTLTALAAEVKRESKVDLFKVYGRSEYQDREEEMTAQNSSGGALYDYYFTERWFGELFLQLEHDKFKDLRLRTKVGASTGYAFVKNEAMRLTGDIGVAYINEDYKNLPDDSFAALKLGERFSWKISEVQSIEQVLEAFPNLEKFSDTLIHFELTYRNLLGGGVFADITVIDDYDSDPPPGIEKNDVKVLASVGYKF